MAKATPARIRANEKFNKKAYQELKIRVRSDSDLNKAVLQTAANKVAGGSLNGFVVDAVARRIVDVLTNEEIAAARAAAKQDKDKE